MRQACPRPLWKIISEKCAHSYHVSSKATVETQSLSNNVDGNLSWNHRTWECHISFPLRPGDILGGKKKKTTQHPNKQKTPQQTNTPPPQQIKPTKRKQHKTNKHLLRMVKCASLTNLLHHCLFQRLPWKCSARRRIYLSWKVKYSKHCLELSRVNATRTHSAYCNARCILNDCSVSQIT